MSNLEDFTMPDRGFVFWPVGTGDSTTIVIDEDRLMQVDIRQMESSTEEDDPHAPVVDLLVEHLPQVNGSPYLSTLCLRTLIRITVRDSQTSWTKLRSAKSGLLPGC